MATLKKLILVAFFGGIGLGISIALMLYVYVSINSETEHSSITGNSELRLNVPMNKEQMDKKSSEYEFPYTPCYKLLISNHELHTGENTVLSLTRNSQGDWDMIDDESYEKLSIELVTIRPGRIELPSNSVKLFYSTGGTVWVHKCAGRYATEATGYIDIRETDENHISADISINLISTLARDLATTGEVEVKFTGVFNRANELY